MWPSEEVASSWYNIANWGLILGLVVGIGSTIMVVWMGNVKEAYLRTQLADTQRETAQARMETERLRSETQPRRLTGAQKDKLRDLLANHSIPIGVVSRVLDTESMDFADDFASAFQEAKWSPLRIKTLLSREYGVLIGTTSAALNASAPVKALDEALTSIGIPHSVAVFTAGDLPMTPPIKVNLLYLVIHGHPPLPTPK